MKKQYLIVEHRNSNAFNTLKRQVDQQKSIIKSLMARCTELENLYGCEVNYNNALCDLLRENNIAFRNVFSHDYRVSKYR